MNVNNHFENSNEKMPLNSMSISESPINKTSLKSVPENVSKQDIIVNIKKLEQNVDKTNNKRKMILYMILFIFLLLSVLLASSYAYFNVDTANTNKLGNIVGTIDCMGVQYSESNTIDLENTMPVTDEYALENYTPVTVTLTNNCPNTVYYYFTFSSLSNNSGYISDNKVNITVDKETHKIDNSVEGYRTVYPKYVSYLIEVPETNSFNSTLMADLNRRNETKNFTNKKNYVLDHDSILTGETKTYDVYLWVDYYEGDSTHSGINNNTTQGLAYKGSLGIVPVNNYSFAKHVIYSGSRSIYGNSNDVDGNPRKVTDECSASGCTTVDIQVRGQYIYYYRVNTFNNAIFGGYCWRAVRTTSMGGVKLLYNGLPTTVDDHLECGNDTNTINNNALYKFNSTGVATANQQTPASVGYMYNATTGTLRDMLQADDVNKYDSEIKVVLDNWYTNWVTTNNIDEKKLEPAVYCNDRTLGTGDGNNFLTAFLDDTLDDLQSGKSYPFSSKERDSSTLKCAVTDSFSINNPKAGGSNMKNIGMLTSDEALMISTSLSTSNTVWLMTPYLIRKDSATQYYTRLRRTTTSGGLDTDRSHQTQKVRPVVTVNTTVYITKGTGTLEDPFILSE